MIYLNFLGHFRLQSYTNHFMSRVKFHPFKEQIKCQWKRAVSVWMSDIGFDWRLVIWIFLFHSFFPPPLWINYPFPLCFCCTTVSWRLEGKVNVPFGQVAVLLQDTRENTKDSNNSQTHPNILYLIYNAESICLWTTVTLLFLALFVFADSHFYTPDVQHPRVGTRKQNEIILTTTNLPSKSFRVIWRQRCGSHRCLFKSFHPKFWDCSF